MEFTVAGVEGVSPDHLEVKCQDSNGNDVRLLSARPAAEAARQAEAIQRLMLTC